MMDFTWAQTFPELHKICSLFCLSELNNPVDFAYTPLQPYLQNGPQCGLVALAIYRGNPNEEYVQQLVRTAQNNGYTNHGEMFSVPNMATLAESQLESTDVLIYKGCLNSDEIKKLLLDGACILVPYDTSKNFSPGFLNGTKAHWAIVCGGVQTESDFYVFARHGNARNVGIWKLSGLAESNGQLNEVKRSKDPSLVFKLPEGGIQGPLGLKSQSVILKRKFNVRKQYFNN